MNAPTDELTAQLRQRIESIRTIEGNGPTTHFYEAVEKKLRNQATQLGFNQFIVEQARKSGHISQGLYAEWKLAFREMCPTDIQKQSFDEVDEEGWI